jgi:C-terminal processing protease CtpA/Prc
MPSSGGRPGLGDVAARLQDDSQAKAAGLAVGDELIRVEGIEVPGNGAFTLKPHMEFVPGKPKRLMFRRADGSTYEATLTKPLP